MTLFIYTLGGKREGGKRGKEQWEKKRKKGKRKKKKEKVYCNMACCSFLLLSVSRVTFLKKALFPPFNSLFLLLFRSM